MTVPGGAAFAVVVPCYNPGPPLQDLVRGCLTDPHLAELVLVDDASPAPEWRAQLPADPRLRVEGLAQNQGAAGARHHGALVSTAPLLCFVDQDDLLLAGHLGAAAALHGAGFDVVVSAGWKLREGALWPLYARTQRDLSAERLLAGPWIASPGQVTMTRAAYQAAGGFRSSIPVPLSDFDLWIRLFRLPIRREFNARRTFIWREHGRGVSGSSPMADHIRYMQAQYGVTDVPAPGVGRRMMGAVGERVRAWRSVPASRLAWTSAGWRVA